MTADRKYKNSYPYLVEGRWYLAQDAEYLSGRERLPSHHMIGCIFPPMVNEIISTENSR